jgi:hypothetical protein
MPTTRKDSTAAPEAPTPGQPRVNNQGRKWLLHLALPLGAGLGLLAAVLVIGDLARESLRKGGGYTISFADIECKPPEGLTRRQFLEEAQYLAGLPDEINLLERDVNARLAEGLLNHPWVEAVKRVEQLPARRVRVELVYRTPVLRVATPEREVDANGVLLPRSALRKGLPVLRSRVAPPLGGPGQPWGDEAVHGAAAVAGLLRLHLETLKLVGCTVEVDHGDVVLFTPRRGVVWGRPPGRERSGEARPEDKLKRLLGAPGLAEHDLRTTGR